MQIVLDSFGASISTRDGMLLIRPKAGQPQTIAVRKVSSILLNRGIKITSDAVMLALENDIRIIFSGKGGKAKGFVWNSRFGSIATVRKNQLAFAQANEGKIWAVKRIAKKVQHQAAFLLQIGHSMPELLQTFEKAVEVQHQIAQHLKKETISKDNQGWEARLRGWEGTASRRYFRAISEALPEKYQFKDRNRRPAKDPFNCVLNYLYGILYSIVEIDLVKAGIDPQIGIFHADQYKHPVMVFDFIEPYRHWADTIAFRLCKQYLLTDDCFEKVDGGIWMASNGKKIVIHAFNSFLDERVIEKGKPRKRINHLELEARALATKLIKFKP